MIKNKENVLAGLQDGSLSFHKLSEARRSDKEVVLFAAKCYGDISAVATFVPNEELLSEINKDLRNIEGIYCGSTKLKDLDDELFKYDYYIDEMKRNYIAKLNRNFGEKAKTSETVKAKLDETIGRLAFEIVSRRDRVRGQTNIGEKTVLECMDSYE